ncbi:type VII secretion protein EccB [Actinomadura craniellae]|uniref:Type VII secretion protein EccB n=1 Tax=Actinomadura craniellae TaxID=2231787 RepID=A0A365GX94_9ACTN|nr:type VII secretion protein EccB [Actinomadura craniellae]RAY11455.1 type VII secretion protein EccB [Actinomadura craniellae]
MQTRKDLHQAHRLMTQRVALALLQGRPDVAESPIRRVVVATISGTMVAVVVAAGFGIWGLVFKGGARGLDRPGTLIIEKETGAKYGYSAADRKLIPFLNYASARLAMPGGQVQHRSVSRKSLARYDRGPVTGIPGAPDALPDARKLAGGPWSLCFHTTGSPPVPTVSLVGGRDVGGRVLPGDRAVLVQAEGRAWLVWDGKRLSVSPGEVRVLGNDQPVPVDVRWLNGLPQGPDFKAPQIPDRGERVPGPDGAAALVGQVYRVAAVAGGEERWYVQLPGGLAGISTTQARLLLADPRGRGVLDRHRDISAAVAGAHPAPTTVHDRNLPQTMPEMVPYDPGTPLCAVYRDAARLSTRAVLVLGGSLPAPRAPVGRGGLDQVVLPGGGTVAGLLPGPGQRPQAIYLVTGQGVRYPVPTEEDLTKLGYLVRSAVPMPGNLLQLMPEGPVLAANAALTPVRPGP